MSPKLCGHDGTQTRPNGANADDRGRGCARQTRKLLVDESRVIEWMQPVIGEAFRRFHRHITSEIDRIQYLQARVSHREPVGVNQGRSKTISHAGYLNRSPVLA